jgi:cell division protein FtsW (lipid II flippase)
MAPSSFIRSLDLLIPALGLVILGVILFMSRSYRKRGCKMTVYSLILLGLVVTEIVTVINVNKQDKRISELERQNVKQKGKKS